ncbi:hypothetical protein TNCV_137711 [Trichonephila clavipes]|nr:hypothetical protein TNCV_137711 [Trichonephila clavipes]
MSSFLVLREGDNRNRWRDGQVYPDVGQEIMSVLGQKSQETRRGSLPWIEKTLEESPGWNGLEQSAKEKDLVREWSGKEGKMMNTPVALKNRRD